MTFWEGVRDTFQSESGSNFRNVRNKVNLLVDQRRRELVDETGREKDANEYTNAIDAWLAILDDEERERTRRTKTKEAKIVSLDRANRERAALTMGRYERRGLASRAFSTVESPGGDGPVESIEEDDPQSESEALETLSASTPIREVSTSRSESGPEVERRARKRKRGGEDLGGSPLVVGLFRELLGAVKTPAPLDQGEELRRQLQEATERVAGVEEKVDAKMTELKTQLDQILAVVSGRSRQG